MAFKSTSKTKKPLRKGVFWVPFILLIITLIFGAVNSEGFSNLLTTAMNFCFAKLGWMFNLTTFIWVVLLIILMISPWGSVRLGGKDAKPTMSTYNWAAITLCAGMAIGIAFWGVAEPILHYSQPPASMGIEPSTPEAAVWAIKTAIHHWTLPAYGLYLVFGLGIAYAVYNKKKPMAVSSCLYPLLGDRGIQKFGGVIDAITLFAIAGGVAHSLGLGVMQLSNGVAYISGNASLATNKLVWFAITAAIIISYTLSSYSGIDRGIRWLSDQNVKLYIIVLVFLLLVGPAQFILDIGTQSIGAFLGDFVEYSTWMGIHDAGGVWGADSWVASWPVFYWGIFLAYAPVVGMFIARVAYGRTIREFIACNLFVPGLVSVVWFSVFGGSAIYLDAVEGAPLAEQVAADFSVAVYAFLENFPLSKITSIVMILVAAVSFVTLADSMSTSVATLSTSGHTIDDPEPPAKYKIIWALIMGGCAIVGILAGGVTPLKIMGTLAGVPILFIICLAAICLIMFATDKETEFTGFISLYRKWREKKKKEKAAVKE